MLRAADRAEKEARMKAWRLERLGGELSFEDVRVCLGGLGPRRGGVRGRAAASELEAQ
jgi:hypothetical protein